MRASIIRIGARVYIDTRPYNYIGAHVYIIGAHVNIIIGARTSIIISWRACIYRRACVYTGAHVNKYTGAPIIIWARPDIIILTCAPIPNISRTPCGSYGCCQLSNVSLTLYKSQVSNQWSLSAEIIPLLYMVPHQTRSKIEYHETKTSSPVWLPSKPFKIRTESSRRATEQRGAL